MSRLLCLVGLIASTALLRPTTAVPVDTDTTAHCTPATFANLTLSGGAILNTLAVPVLDLPTVPAAVSLVTPPTNPPTSLSFCNVTVIYTHPGQNDTITTTVWLPLKGWNSRLVGLGGGGFLTRMPDDTLAQALQGNYSIVATDGGHPVAEDPTPWALTSKNNVNWVLLNDFASVSLGDAAVLGKAVTEAFYAEPPAHSYFSGCSTGGRQAIMLAQRYPDAYDGIMAAAPAINWAKFVPAMLYPVALMQDLDTYPAPCIFEAITAAAIAACDPLDGTPDGIIAGDCDFDANTLVGQPVACGTYNTTVSPEAAQVANAAWAGAEAEDGTRIWPGLGRGTPLSGPANTTCDTSGANCSVVPFYVGVFWLSLFVARDEEFDIKSLTRSQLARLTRLSHNIYASVISAADPDLTDFKNAEKKLLMLHGKDDQYVPLGGSEKYYTDVLEGDENAEEYFRFFEVPGVQHCSGGLGPAPTEAFDRLVRWVEEGDVVDVLRGTDVGGRVWELPAWVPGEGGGDE